MTETTTGTTAVPRVPANEDDALRLFFELRDTYGWAGAIFTREDAAILLDRKLDDDAWDRICLSDGWACITDCMVDAGTEGLADADRQGLLDLDQED